MLYIHLNLLLAHLGEENSIAGADEFERTNSVAPRYSQDNISEAAAMQEDSDIADLARGRLNDIELYQLRMYMIGIDGEPGIHYILIFCAEFVDGMICNFDLICATQCLEIEESGENDVCLDPQSCCCNPSYSRITSEVFLQLEMDIRNSIARFDPVPD